MFVVFLDEAGSPYVDYNSFNRQYEGRHRGAPPAQCPAAYFVLAGIGIHERHMPMVDEWFAGIKSEFLQNADASPGEEYEIKGELLYALRRGQTPGAWQGVRKQKRKYIAAQKSIWNSLQTRQLARLEQSIFDLLGRLSPVVWGVVINQRDHFRMHQAHAWPPYYLAMTYLQQRVLHHVQAVHGAYERGMFIMDETSTLSTACQFDEYLSMRDVINSNAAWPVEFGRYLVNIPLFGKSHLHESLQLADVVAHAVWRHAQGRDPLGWFGRIEALLAKHWRTRRYANCGLRHIP